MHRAAAWSPGGGDSMATAIPAGRFRLPYVSGVARTNFDDRSGYGRGRRTAHVSSIAGTDPHRLRRGRPPEAIPPSRSEHRDGDGAYVRRVLLLAQPIVGEPRIAHRPGRYGCPEQPSAVNQPFGTVNQAQSLRPGRPLSRAG